MSASSQQLPNSSSFFRNVSCAYFPCHEGVDEREFNCLFCYCPLYALGPACGGDFSYTASGVKDCSGCTVPHRKKNYDYITGQYEKICALAAKKKP